MKRILALAFAALCAVPAVPAAAPLPGRTHDYVRNPAFVPLKLPRRLNAGEQGRVEQVGEVVIVEGDGDIVSVDSRGNFGILFDETTQHPPLITKRFYEKYADEFDEIVLLTTFEDYGAEGAMAYEVSAKQDVRGINLDLFDDSAEWGSTGGQLYAFVNMMRWNQYRDYDGLDLLDPRSEFYPTLGQEFAHRWLSFLRYRKSDGTRSLDMLGRDQAHWASTLQADASVMDGNKWVDNGDGTFTLTETFARFSALDLYGMGLAGESEVPPWFLLRNAVEIGSGKKVSPDDYLRVGLKARADRENITVAQVISAEGARSPSWDKSPHAFRVAFVLVTRPGERAGDVVDTARIIDKMRLVWEKVFSDYTGGRATMCTQVSAPCGAPVARVQGGAIVESGGNGNGVVEPGEPVSVNFLLENDSPAAAQPVAVAVTAERVQIPTTTSTLAELGAGKSTAVTFSGQVPSDAACGAPVAVRAETTVGKYRFRGFAEVIPGLTDLVRDDFEKGPGMFAPNIGGTDKVTRNGWEYGTPVEYLGRSGWRFQPGGGHSGARAWFTGLVEGHRPMTDSSVVGTSTLWSAEYDLSQSYLPVLKYWAWYQAIDFSNPQAGGQVADGIPLLVEGTVDGGKTWFPVDSLEGAETDWREREIRLADLVKDAKKLQLRFTAASPSDTILVEAGIDDVRITTLTPQCNPNAQMGGPDGNGGSGCGCAVAARRSSPAGALALAAFALALLLSRRRRS